MRKCTNKIVSLVLAAFMLFSNASYVCAGSATLSSDNIIETENGVTISDTVDAGGGTDNEAGLADVSTADDEPAELFEQTLRTEIDGTTITIAGLLPERATVSSDPVEVNIDNADVVLAYDISVYYEDGSIFEPEDNTLKVTINSPELSSDAEMFFVSDDGDAQLLDSSIDDDSITFLAEHFSTYVVAVVNEAVVVKIFSEEETVNTGENHQVTIKSSYSATNDGDKATVRIYLQNAEGNVNSAAEILGLVDDYVVYASDNNEKLSITLTHGYEYDGGGNATAEYLEYVLPAGTSVEMELEFYVPTGIYGPTETLVFIPEVVYEEGDGSNDDVSSETTIYWAAGFLWTDLTKTGSVASGTTANGDIPETGISADGILDSDIVYTFSAISNPNEIGIIWTKTTTVVDTITLPGGMTFPEGLVIGTDNADGIYLTDENGDCTTKIIDVSVGDLDFELTNLTYGTDADGNATLSFTITAENPNVDSGSGVLTADYNMLSNLSITVLKEIGLNLDERIWGNENIINNSITAIFTPCRDVDEITLNASCDINLAVSEETISIEKTADATYVEEDGTATYTVTITNNTSEDQIFSFYDLISSDMNLIEYSELTALGLSVGKHVDTIYTNSEMQAVTIGDGTETATEVVFEIEETVDLAAGASALVKITLPETDDEFAGSIAVTGILGILNADSSAISYSATVTVDFTKSELAADGTRSVYAALTFDNSDIDGVTVDSLTVSVISITDSSGNCYSGTLEVGDITVMNGEVDADDADTITSGGTTAVLYEDTNGYDASEVTFDSSSWWDQHTLNEAYPDISADNFEIVGTSQLTVDVTNNASGSLDCSGYYLVIGMVDSDWDWSNYIYLQKELGTVSTGTTTYTFSLPSNFYDYQGLGYISIGIVGSGVSSAKNISIGNLQIITTSKLAYQNFISGSINIKAGETVNFSYTVTLNDITYSTVTNEAVVGNDNGWYKAELTLAVVGGTEDADLDQVWINKELVARDASYSSTVQDSSGTTLSGLITEETFSKYGYTYDGDELTSGYAEEDDMTFLNCLSEGAKLYYKITLVNDSDMAQVVTLQDYSPLYYGKGAVDSTNSYYASSIYSGSKDFGGVEYVDDGTIGDFVANDFADNGVVLSYDSESHITTMTIVIPANTTYTQMFVVNVPTGDDFLYWEEYCYYTQFSSYKSNEKYTTVTSQAKSSAAYLPYNSLWLVGTDKYVSVQHSFEKKVQINTYALGEFSSDYRYGSTSAVGTALTDYTQNAYGNRYYPVINYNISDIYNVAADSDTYLIYGVTVTNDSIWSMEYSDLTAQIQIPYGTELVGFVETQATDSNNGMGSSSSYRNYDGSIRTTYPVAGGFTRSDALKSLNGLFGISLGSYKSGKTSSYLPFAMGDEYQLYRTDTSVYTTLASTASSSASISYGSAYTLKMGSSGQLLPAKSSATFYYIVRVKDDYTSSRSNATAATVTVDAPVTTIRMASRQASYVDGSNMMKTYGSYSSSDALVGQSIYYNRDSATGYSTFMSYVSQNFLPTTQTMLYKSVVARNTLEDMESGNATLTLYSTDLNEVTMSEDEVVTFCLAISNGSESSTIYRVEDTLPDGMTFLGFNVLTGDYETNTYTGTTNGLEWSSMYDVDSVTRSTTGTTKTFSVEDYYLSVPYASLKNAYSSEGLSSMDVPDNSFYTFDYGVSERTRMTANDSSVYGSAATVGDTSFYFTITVDANSTVYIFYTAKVSDVEALNEAAEAGETITNTATIYGLMTVFNNAVTAEYYNSAHCASNINEEGRNIDKGEATALYTSKCNPQYDSQALVTAITASVDLTPVPPTKSAKIEKEVVGAYLTEYTGSSYYENEDVTSVVYGSDGKALANILASTYFNSFGVSSGYSTLAYSIVDGIHATQDYRSNIVWKVTVTNDGEEPIDASHIIERMDQPMQMIGYYASFYDDSGAAIGLGLGVNQNPSTGAYEYFEATSVEEASYTSKVTGETVKQNVYDIEVTRYAGSNLCDPSNLLPGYSYELYIFTDMTEEALDWYYNTAVLDLGSLSNYDFQSDVEEYDSTSICASDWISCIASDGEKYISKGTEDEVNSKESLVYLDALTGEKTYTFTLKMMSKLYQTAQYTDGTLSDIIFYDLLPGTSGGLEEDEPGGGYTVDTDSFNAYILKTNGSKVEITSDHYTVSYTTNSLHGGRHPISVNDTVYNVDFAEAVSADTEWHDTYSEDDRAFRVVFDDTVTLEDGDMLYFEYDVTTREDVDYDTEYHNIFGYSYTLTSGSYVVNLYEDTSDITWLPEQQDIVVAKELYDADGNEIVSATNVIEEYEYKFILYQHDADDDKCTEVYAFTLQTGEILDLTEILAEAEVTLEEGALYRLQETISNNKIYTEDQSSYTEVYTSGVEVDIDWETTQKSGTVQYIDFTYAGYGTNVTFKNYLNNTSQTSISKTNTNGETIIFGEDASVSYKIYNSEGELVYFVEVSNGYYYSELEDALSEITSYSNPIYLYGLPEGTYYIEETEAPENYKKNDTKVEFTVTEDQWCGVVLNVTVENEYIGDGIAKLKVNKIDANGNLIASDLALFTITSSSSMVDNLSTAYNFVDEGTDDALGHMYRLADADDIDTVVELETYNGLLYITGLSFDTDYYLYEISAPDGYYYSSSAYTGFAINTTSTVYILGIINQEYLGNVEITKTDENGDVMTETVKFEVYKDADYTEPVYFHRLDDLTNGDGKTTSSCYEYVADTQVDDDCVTEIETAGGKITLTGLPYYYYYNNGSYWAYAQQCYYLVETDAPIGYGLGTSTFYSTYTGETLSVTFQNSIVTGHIEIVKQDDIGNDLTDDVVKFQLYDSEGNLVYVAQDVDGYYVSNISSENTIDTIETTEGKVSVNYLPVGTYTLVEVQTPEGYAVISDTTFTVTDDNYESPLEVTVQNQHDNGNFTLTKVDSQSNIITSDTASFEIYDADENLVKFTMSGGEYVYDTEGTETALTTTDGILTVKDIPIGAYTIVETDAPEGYLISEPLEITITGSHYYEDLEVAFMDYHDSGDVMIVKLDTDGELISSNSIVFQLYDSDGNLVKLYYTGEKTDDGRIYSTTGTGYQYSRLTSYGGKIYIVGLPVGNYYLKEVVAPTGYSLYLDEIPFTVTDENYYEALIVQVQDPEYIFGSGEYVSSSYQKIEEKDEPDNYAYGYNGTSEDYANGNYNYIVVDSAEDIITFTLRVMNRSEKNFENVVIIDSLADIDDTGAVNLNQDRGSEFTISLADEANFAVSMYDENGNAIAVASSEYTVSYSTQTSYTDDDWDGMTTWDTAASATTRSFRVVMDEDFVLPSGYTLQVTFDAVIQDNADPLEIAWNAFGYRYYVGSTELTPEPPKVGVKIPTSPYITKEVIDGASETDTYDFYVYEVADDGSETLIRTLSVLPNVKTEIEPLRTVNGVISGYIEADKTYKIVEATSKKTTLLDVTGSTDSIKEMTFNFTYDSEASAYAIFTNGRSYNGEVVLTKTDFSSGELLEGVKYELRSSDGTIIYTVTEDDGIYVYDINSMNTELVTNANGQIKIAGLPYGNYVLVETESLDGYILDEAGIVFAIDDDDFEIIDETLTVIVEELTATNSLIDTPNNEGGDGDSSSSDEFSSIEEVIENIREKILTGISANATSYVPILAGFIALGAVIIVVILIYKRRKR